MASENWKHGDKIPPSTPPRKAEEPGFHFMNNGAAQGAGMADFTMDAGASDMPPNMPSLIPVLSHAPLHLGHTQLATIDLTSDTFSKMGNVPSLPGLLSQSPYLGRSVNEIHLDLAPFGSLQMHRQAREANASTIGMPQSPRNTTQEMEARDNNTSAIRSCNLEKLDGSFLTLGIGSTAEVTSECNVFRKDTTCTTGRNIGPQLGAYYGQKADGSYLNPGSKITTGFSSFKNSADGFADLARKMSGLLTQVQNVGEISGVADNVATWSLYDGNVGTLGGTSTRFSSSSSNMLSTSQRDKHSCFLMPNNWNTSREGNNGPMSANADPSKCLQDFPGVSSVPLNSCQAEWGDSGRQRIAPCVTSSSTTKLASGQLQKSSSRLPAFVVSPFHGVTRSTFKWDQLGQESPACNSSAIQTTEGGLFPENIDLQAASHSFPFIEGRAARVAEGNVSQSRARPSKDLVLYTSGQVIPVSKGSGLAQGSNVLAETSRRRSKRTLSQSPPATSQVQCKKNRRIEPYVDQAVASVTSLTPTSVKTSLETSSSFRPSVQTTTPAPVTLVASPSPLLAQTASLPTTIPSPPCFTIGNTTSLPCLTQSRHLPTLACPAPRTTFVKMASSLHIKWQGSEKPPQLSGHKCFLCKRDLSYAPEGPFILPTVSPEVAVLACGHCFHWYCLQRITPEDQVSNPPCIPCAMGEK